MTLLATRQHDIGATFDGALASELGVLPYSLVTNLAGVPITTSESFTAGGVTKLYQLAGAPIPSSEAFGTGVRIFPKGATGTHPTTNDTRTTVTGPEDLSGKKFTNPVLLTGSGLTGSRVAFSRKPTFQDCDASLSDVWFDQTSTNGLCDIIGATTTTNVTIRRFTAIQYAGSGPVIDGAHIGTVTFINGLFRPAAAPAGLNKSLTGSPIPSSEAFTAGAVTKHYALAGSPIPSGESFGVGSLDIAGALGGVVPFTVVDIGDQIYGTYDPTTSPPTISTDPRDGPEDWPGAQLWRAQRWVDLYLDKACDLGGGVVVNFGRSDKTPPAATVGQITIGTNGVPIDTATGLAISSGYSVVSVGSPAVITTTLDVQCASIKVNGDPLHPERLVITGKVWVVDPIADNSATLAAFNATWDSTTGGNGIFEFHDCTLALSNVYVFGGNVNADGRYDNCHRLTSSTPMVDGGFFDAFAHDGFNTGGYTDMYMRHCSWRPHTFIAAYTDPILVGKLPLFDPVTGLFLDPPSLGGAKPTKWSASRVYNRYDAATSPTDAQSKFYCLVDGTPAGTPLPADGLGGHNAHWQYYGNLHADEEQGYAMLNATAIPSYENCFWFKGQHVSIYLEKASKVYFNKVNSPRSGNPSSWDAGTNYVGVNPPNTTTKSDLVRGSDGVEWVAIQNSGPASGGARDPANNANPAYWIRGSAYNITGRYCISHGNNTGFSNPNLNPPNGFLDTVFGRDFALNPVQANGNNDTADGVHIVNKRNRYAWSNATPTANPFVDGSTTV